MKKNTKIIVVFIAVILIFTAAFLLWKSSTSPENTETIDTLIIDTLEVSYRKPSDSAATDLPAADIHINSVDSKYIISATVSELKNTNGSKECYLDVNEALKGNIEVNQIFLRTQEKEPELKEGDEYILFIKHLEQNNIDYYYLPQEGYLLKNGSAYEGMNPKISITYNGLKSRLYFMESFYSDGKWSFFEDLFMRIFF